MAIRSRGLAFCVDGRILNACSHERSRRSRHLLQRPQCVAPSGFILTVSARRDSEPAPILKTSSLCNQDGAATSNLLGGAPRKARLIRAEEFGRRVGNGLPASVDRDTRNAASTGVTAALESSAMFGRANTLFVRVCRRREACRRWPSVGRIHVAQAVRAWSAARCVCAPSVNGGSLSSRRIASCPPLPRQPAATYTGWTKHTRGPLGRQAPRCRGRRHITVSACISHQEDRVLLRPPAARLRWHLQASARPQNAVAEIEVRRLARRPQHGAATSPTSSASSKVGSIATRSQNVLRHDDPLVTPLKQLGEPVSSC